MKKVVLAGNGLTAEILFEYLYLDDRYAVVGVVADDEFVLCDDFLGVPCIKFSELSKYYGSEDIVIVMAMGYGELNRSRQSMFERLKSHNYAIETYIHNDAKVYTRYDIGDGSVVLPGAVVEPFCRVGSNTLIWCNTTIAHHASIDSHCWLASGSVISGGAIVRDNTFIGVNATIVNGVEVSKLNIVGANALISKCTQPNTVHLSRSGEQFRYSSEEYIKFFGV